MKLVDILKSELLRVFILSIIPALIAIYRAFHLSDNVYSLHQELRFIYVFFGFFGFIAVIAFYMFYLISSKK